MTGADSVFLDTNVLLAAITPSRRLHDAAIRVLDETSTRGFVSNQVLRELLVVSTRPTDVNGLGLGCIQAARNVDVLLKRTRLLPEDHEVAARLNDFVRRGLCRGKQVHDANIAATMLAHGVPTLITGNPTRFQRFADLIAVRDLSRV
jgi:predicted nucleic acid-binding protein